MIRVNHCDIRSGDDRDRTDNPLLAKPIMIRTRLHVNRVDNIKFLAYTSLVGNLKLEV